MNSNDFGLDSLPVKKMNMKQKKERRKKAVQYDMRFLQFDINEGGKSYGEN